MTSYIQMLDILSFVDVSRLEEIVHEVKTLIKINRMIHVAGNSDKMSTILQIKLCSGHVIKFRTMSY